MRTSAYGNCCFATALGASVLQAKRFVPRKIRQPFKNDKISADYPLKNDKMSV